MKRTIFEGNKQNENRIKKMNLCDEIALSTCHFRKYMAILAVFARWAWLHGRGRTIGTQKQIQCMRNFHDWLDFPSTPVESVISMNLVSDFELGVLDLRGGLV